MLSDPVLILEYDTAWPEEFAQIGRSLRAILSGAALRIDHIGSTAVPQMAAKPVIDIQVSVSSLTPGSGFVEPLQSAGWVWDRDNPELTKRFFREPLGTRRVHLHVRVQGSFHEQLSLLFRDYLRQNAHARRSYEEVKRSAAAMYRHERLRYGEAKDPVIWGILRDADRWAAATGWRPGSTDS